MKKLIQFKQWVLSIIIGHYYTEKEVYKILHKMQYDMAQKIIGNRPEQKTIVPVDYFKEHGKYKDTNLYTL